MENNAFAAIQSVNNGQLAYCKFLSPNDTGETGGHQGGPLINNNAYSMLFDKPREKGSSLPIKRKVKINWFNKFTTDATFTYYASKGEYRITGFGRGFPYFHPDYIGDLFVFVKNDDANYTGFILETDDEIETFFDAFALNSTDTGSLISKTESKLENTIENAFSDYIQSLEIEFPSTKELALAARQIFNALYNHHENIKIQPDIQLIKWVNFEYDLFRKLEFTRYGTIIQDGFDNVEEFIETANKVLNSRKSRAGKSLEHQLSAIFDENIPNIYQSQCRSEGKKRPDFLFPNEAAYHDPNYPADRLIFLAAKRTCKDRWRQVINEANRIKNKHLFTLQQGISLQQLQEMEDEKVTLVVPEPYIQTYPSTKRESIWTLQRFINHVKTIIT